jgi:hypothetical protein
MRTLNFLSSVFLVYVLCIPRVSGQEQSEYRIMDYLQKRNPGGGELVISMDNLIVQNLHRHILYNARNPAIPGYRIRIFSDSGFDSYDRAISSKARFITNYENIGSYLQYDVPDYKVYVGDCRTKSEAQKILEMIKKDFPYAFIVPQNINLGKE